jgi:hypothetical protein
MSAKSGGFPVTATKPLDLEAIRARAVASVREAEALIAWHSALLVLARTDIPALVAEVERLREALRKVKATATAFEPDGTANMERHSVMGMAIRMDEIFVASRAALGEGDGER